MHRYRSIARAAALETLSDPLGLLLSVSAMAVIVLASVFHIHQFGESWRMARDAALSSILVFMALDAVFSSIRAVRGEIESGTLQMALSHSVSRFGYCAARFAGLFAACILSFAPVVFTGLSIILGAQAGGIAAAQSGDIPLVWGPAVAAASASITIPLLAGAAMNRFANARFAVSATVCALAVSAVSYAALLFYARSSQIAMPEIHSAALRMLPAIALLFPPVAVLAAAAQAFSFRFGENASATLCGVFCIAMLPALGNHYLSETLAEGGSVPWGYAGLAAAASVPFVLAFLAAGAALLEAKDM